MLGQGELLAHAGNEAGSELTSLATFLLYESDRRPQFEDDDT